MHLLHVVHVRAGLRRLLPHRAAVRLHHGSRVLGCVCGKGRGEGEPSNERGMAQVLSPVRSSVGRRSIHQRELDGKMDSKHKQTSIDGYLLGQPQSQPTHAPA